MTTAATLRRRALDALGEIDGLTVTFWEGPTNVPWDWERVKATGGITNVLAIDAPDGLYFATPDTHAIYVPHNPGDTAADCWDAIAHDLADGLARCAGANGCPDPAYHPA